MKSYLSLRAALAVLAIVVLSIFSAMAQETTATVSGAVKDESGAVVPGVTVNIKNVATGVARTVVTESDGRYTVPQLAPGDYQVEASMTGFQTELRSGINLTVGRHATVDITLKVGSVGEKVEVTGEAPLVETTSANLAGLVNDKQIRELPLNGRNFVQLTLLEPGVVQARSAGNSAVVGGGLKMNFNGARMDYNNYILDGTTMNSVNQQAIGGASGEAMGVETIQEYQVLTSNYSAEFGRAAGGVVNVVTKSGTNDLHGTLFEFLRNSKMDAKNFFDIGSQPPAFKRNQFGGSVGGPIQKDKMFFFVGYEGLRERLAQTLTGNVPTVAARQGGLVPVASSVVPYLGLWPLPNGRDLGNGTGQFIYSPSQPTNQDFGQVRVDRVLSPKDTIFVRYTIDDSIKTTPQNLPTYVWTDRLRSEPVTLSYTRIISPTTLNVLRLGYNRSEGFYDQAPVNSTLTDASLWFLPNQNTANLGSLSIPNVADPDSAVANRPNDRLDNVYQVLDTVNRTWGRYSLKFGGEFQRIQTNENDTNSGQGQFVFTNLNSFLQGIPSSFVGVTNDQTFVRGWRQDLVGMFVQNDVRMTQRLTLNLGLRWEFTTNPNEVNGRSSHYDGLLTTDTLVVANPIYKTPKANFAPRFGFAWDVNGDGKTSIRGGFGLYDAMLFRNYYFSSRLLPPFGTTLGGNAPNLSFPHPLANLKTSQTTAPQLEQWQDNRQPYAMQWNLTVQRQILPSTVLTVAYVGSRGLFLGRFNNPNVAVPVVNGGAGQPGDQGTYFYPLGSVRRDPNFTTVTYKTLSASSMYNGLQVKLAKQLTKGFQAQASYTWAHSLDSASGQLQGDFGNSSAFPQNPWNINSTEWGNSAFDLRQMLVVNYTYVLPFASGRGGVVGKLIRGWETNGIFNATTGVPFTVQNSSSLNIDRSGTGGASRPNLVAGMSNNPTGGMTAGCPGFAAGQKVGTPNLYFDPCAFQLQAPGFYGNLGRNTLIGPGLVGLDFGLVKNTSITERISIQFRAEMFNVLNHANFGIPANTVFTSATPNPVTGQPAPSTAAAIITQTVTTSRQLQFGLKLTF